MTVVSQLGKVAGKEVLEIRNPKDSEQTPEADVSLENIMKDCFDKA